MSFWSGVIDSVKNVGASINSSVNALVSYVGGRAGLTIAGIGGFSLLLGIMVFFTRADFAKVFTELVPYIYSIVAVVETSIAIVAISAAINQLNNPDASTFNRLKFSGNAVASILATALILTALAGGLAAVPVFVEGLTPILFLSAFGLKTGFDIVTTTAHGIRAIANRNEPNNAATKDGIETAKGVLKVIIGSALWFAIYEVFLMKDIVEIAAFTGVTAAASGVVLTAAGVGINILEERYLSDSAADTSTADAGMLINDETNGEKAPLLASPGAALSYQAAQTALSAQAVAIDDRLGQTGAVADTLQKAIDNSDEDLEIGAQDTSRSEPPKDKTSWNVWLAGGFRRMTSWGRASVPTPAAPESAAPVPAPTTFAAH